MNPEIVKYLFEDWVYLWGFWDHNFNRLGHHRLEYLIQLSSEPLVKPICYFDLVFMEI
jgi:hypothetical protein